MFRVNRTDETHAFVAVLVVVTSTVLLAGFVSASPGGAGLETNTVTNHTTDQTQSDLSVELQPQDQAGFANDDGFSQAPAVTFDQDITFDGGTTYQVVVQDVDAGGELVVEPPADGGVDAGQPLRIYVRNGSGEPFETGILWGLTLDDGLPLTTSGSFSTSGIVNQRVEVRNTETGETVAQTVTKPYVVGYDKSVTTTITDSTVRLSVPREPFPSNSTVRFSLAAHGTASTSLPQQTVTASYESDGDAFVATLDSGSLPAGNYTYNLSVTHSSGILFSAAAEELDSSYEDQPPLVVEGTQTDSFRLPSTDAPATNLDDDSLLEDIDGDGTGDVFDVVTYYNNRKTDVIQNNPERFDFDGDGEVGTVFDALALYNELE